MEDGKYINTEEMVKEEDGGISSASKMEAKAAFCGRP